ncbi:MAG: NUDIX domain-containing protein [Kosmotogaceae bacterium]
MSNVVHSEGLLKIEISWLSELMEKNGKYIPREKAEIDERYRQIIPYVVLKDHDGYYLFKRTKKQGEKRLHEKYTLGVGGHVNQKDSHKDGVWKSFEEGMQREVKEEVEIVIKSIEYLGLINDLSTPVSRVHLGVAYIADIVFFGLNEPDKFEVEQFPLSELRKFEEKMEGWSRLVLMEILKKKS